MADQTQPLSAAGGEHRDARRPAVEFDVRGRVGGAGPRRRELRPAARPGARGRDRRGVELLAAPRAEDEVGRAPRHLERIGDEAAKIARAAGRKTSITLSDSFCVERHRDSFLDLIRNDIDIVFANAGVGEFVPFGAVTEEHFDKIFGTNVRGLLFTVQKALPLMPKGASIVLNASITSMMAPVVMPMSATLNAGK